MEVQQAQKQQHDHQAQHRPLHHCSHRVMALRGCQRVRQQMHEGDPEHHTGYQAHGQLSAHVRHGKKARQTPPQQGGGEKRHSVDREKREGRHVRGAPGYRGE